MPPVRRHLPLPVAALLLCTCGSASTSSAGCTPPPSAPIAPPTAVAGPVTLSADQGRVARGGALRLTVTISGPAQVAAPCTAPVSLVVSDATGIHVFSEIPAAQPGDVCGDLALTAGQSAVFHLRWNVDPTLPSGRYTLAVMAGDQPEISVGVDVGGAVAGAPAC